MQGSIICFLTGGGFCQDNPNFGRVYGQIRQPEKLANALHRVAIATKSYREFLCTVGACTLYTPEILLVLGFRPAEIKLLVASLAQASLRVV